MTSKSSYSKSGLIKFGLNRQIWAVAVSAAAFFLTTLLPVIMTVLNIADYEGARENTAYTLSKLFQINLPARLVMSALAVAMGVHAFAYLHSRQKTDFYHSLPIKRQGLFGIQFAGGILAVLPAFLVMQTAAFVVAYMSGFGDACSVSQMLSNLLVNSVMFLCIYALAALCTILCGNTIVSLLLFGWAAFSPSAAAALSMGMHSYFYEGFYRAPLAEALTFRLSPVIGYLIRRVPPAALLGYAAAAILLTALAFVLFRIRKSESAGNALAFKRMQKPFKIWCMLVMGAAAGLLLGSITYHSTGWMYFGILIGCVLTHCIIETIYAFDFKAVFQQGKSLAAGALILLIVSAGMHADITGYNSYVPKDGAVKAATLSTYRFNRGHWLSASDWLTEKDNIDAVLALARMNRRTEDFNEDEEYCWINIGYELNSGRTVWRDYSVPMGEVLDTCLEQILYSAEYTVKGANAFRAELTGNDRLGIESLAKNWDGKSTTLMDQTQIAEIIAAAQRETLAMTAQQAKTDIPLFSLWFESYRNINEQNTYLGGVSDIIVYESFTETLALIEQYADMDIEMLHADEIARLQLSRSKWVPAEIQYDDDPLDAEKNITQYAEITEKEQIAAILEMGRLVSDRAVHNSDWGYSYFINGSVRDEWEYTIDVWLTNGTMFRAYYVGGMPYEMLSGYFENA